MWRQLLLCFFTLLICSCAIPVLREPGELYQQTLKRAGFPVVDYGIETSTRLKHYLLEELARWPRVVELGAVRRVELHPRIEAGVGNGNAALGLYHPGTRSIHIAVLTGARDFILARTLYHEIGHAIWRNMLTDAQRKVWTGQYELRRLQRRHVTRYSRISAAEFFCEHLAQACTDFEYDGHIDWRDEFILLDECGALPDLTVAGTEKSSLP